MVLPENASSDTRPSRNKRGYATAKAVAKAMAEPLFLTVLFVVSLCRFFRVRPRVKCVSAGRMSVMRRLFVMSRIVMLGRFAMMASRMGMVF